jgi:hypothetical protein
VAVVVGTPTVKFVHSELLTGICGNGPAATVTLIDPETGSTLSEPFGILLGEVTNPESMNWPKFVQIQ